jgi:1-deoxy-D-xylulose-5-phosphate synthase
MSFQELSELACEIRQFLLFYLSKTGGHLASNLGVVELTLALHYVFDSPKDKLIWDVGHQTYVHKILTDRKEVFHSLRQYGGLSGFPKRNESEHDCFETGHSSTSISAALGIARSRDILGESFKVAAIIGDGSLTGGLAFEALNDAGHSATDITAILNDNQMCISPNVGALAKHLSRIRTHPKYEWFIKGIGKFFDRLPILGKFGAKVFEKLKKSLKYFFVPGIIFEEMGFRYLGPVDGHDLPNLITILKRSIATKGPVLIHVVTTKGKGYDIAESSPDVYHSVPPFKLKTGEFKPQSPITFSQVLGEHLIDMAKRDKRVTAITAAMAEGTGLAIFREHFSDRFFDVGIAEQHAVTLAAGMASQGIKPYVAVYSTFLQRAYDQILHDVCIQRLPVTLLIDRAGIAGEDGETHHGMFDIAFMRHIPNITIWAPKSTEEFRQMLDLTLSINAPVAIRYEKGPSGQSELPIFEEETLFTQCWEILKKGNDCLVLTFGRMLSISCKAAELLASEDISLQIVNARVIKPLDERMLLNMAKHFSKWITIEDSAVHGGFGSFINEFVVHNNLNISMLNIGMPDSFIPHGKVDILLERFGLNSNGIALQISSFLGGSKKKHYVGI